MKALLSITLFCLVAISVPAFAGTLRGKITDNKGAALPFATVYVQGTTIGTSANTSGIYELRLEPGSYRIISQYMGFKQSVYDIVVNGAENIDHDFVLEDQGLEIKEFVVKASEDPAMYIMRQVIKRRTFHLNQIQAFQTDMYLKGVLRMRDAPDKMMGEKIDKGELGLDTSGKGILFLVEEQASFYTDGDKDRTVIHSVRQSGNPSGLGFSQFPSVINFYANSIDISEQLNPRGFISPVSDRAFSYYKFKLEGDFKEGDHTIFKIKVTPKRDYEPLFEGILYIVDEDWAIHSLNMLVTKKNSLEFLDSFRIQQLYLPLSKDQWVIKQQVYYPSIKLFGFDAIGHFVTVYDNQKINQPIPDTIFNNKKLVSIYDKTAINKDSNYWNESRPVPLEADEQKDYKVKDSTRHYYESPAYIDSIRRMENKPRAMNLLLSGYTYNTKSYKTNIITNSSLTGLINYNTVEGWNTAPKVWIQRNIDTFHRLNIVAAARYGFQNMHFNAIGKIGYTIYDKAWRTRSSTFEVEGGKYVFQFNPYNPIQPLYNSIASLFYRQNYLKLYERLDAAIGYKRNLGNGFSYGIRAAWQQRIPLENSSSFSYADANTGGFTENIPEELKKYSWSQHNAFLTTVNLSWQPGFTYSQYPNYLMPHGSDYPTFSLTYTKGIPDIFNSQTDYDKWRVSVRDDVSLKLLGDLSYNVAAGGFLNANKVSIPDLMHLNGNQVKVATPYLESFQVAPYYLYSNKEKLYGEAHIEWHLKGFITNKIPLLRQLRWYLVAGNNSFYASKDLYHTEMFVGIDNLGYDKLRFLRVDYVWGWNHLNQRLSGIRVGISTSSIISLRGPDRGGSEW